VLLKPFGGTGEQVASIGQGTWDLPESGARCSEAKAALRRGLELGMTHVDTAEMYGAGRVEEIVGQAIAGFPREQIFLASKVLPANAGYDAAIAACEGSLKRLRTSYLDLYMLHWPSEHPLEETMRALEALVRAGKTRFIGVSNFDVPELDEARSYLRGIPLACNQVLYHLRERAPELRLLPYCRENGVALVAYTPFGRGKFPRDAINPGGLLERIASKHAKTPRQVILAFLTRDSAAFAVAKASRVEHVEENAGAAFALDAADVAELDSTFPVRDGPLATL